MKKLNYLFKSVIFVFATLISLYAVCIPANKKPITVKQPNGQTLTVILQGDEWVNWAKTLDGYSLLKNDQGAYVYAMKDGKGNMIPSDIVASNENLRTAKEKNFLASMDKHLTFSALQKKKKTAAFEKNLTQVKANTSFPTIGTDSLLVILVYFTDLDFTYTNQNFVDMTSEKNYNNTGSVRDYYLDNSDGLFEMAIRVVGPYKLPHNMAYYGGNEDQYTNYTNFCQDAVAAADADVDYSHFDNDGDGYVDGVHIIFAGTPESTTGTEDEIWPHRWSIYPVEHDDTYISTYSCSAEKRSSTEMDGIGTMAHEFGHVLGLPDNYDADYEESGGTSVTTGRYDLMANGSYNNNGNTPPYLSMGEKIITKWANIDTLLSGGDGFRVPTVTGHNDTAYYIAAEGGEEFFIIEARNKSNKWDAYIPSSGMLIYHGVQSKIDGWLNYGSRVNTEPANRGWFIEPADGITEHGDQKEAAFAGVSQITSFSPNSLNKPTLNDGTELDLAVTDIAWLNDSVMTFSVNSSNASVEALSVNDEELFVDGFTLNGKVISIGNETITKKGFVYSSYSNVDMNNGTIVYDNDNDLASADISVTVNNLASGKYYYRAFLVSTDTTVLSSVKRVYTRIVDISEPTFEMSDEYGIVAEVSYTKYDLCEKYVSLIGGVGVIENNAVYYGMTEFEMMDYYVNNGYALYNTEDQSYYYGGYSLGDTRCIYVLAITTDGDSILYKRTFTVTLDLPAPSLTISNVDSVYDDSKLAALYTITPNENTTKYFAGLWNDNTIEDFATEQNMTYNEVLAYLIDNNFVGEYTAEEQFGYYINPNTDYEIVAWAVGNGDTVMFKKSFGFTLGGSGTAVAVISSSAVTANSADIDITINDETAFYTVLFAEKDTLEYYGIYDTYDAGSYSDTYLNQMTQYTENLSTTLTNLHSNTSYIVYVIPYNAQNTHGNVVSSSFTTLSSAGIPQVNISDVDTFTYNGQLAAEWSYKKNGYCSKYYTFFGSDNSVEDFAQNNNMTTNDVLTYLIENSENFSPLTSDDTHAFYITPNTEYEIVVWAIGGTDTVMYKKSFSFTKGNYGSASAPVTLKSMSDDTAYISVTPNTSTAYYYMIADKTQNFVDAGISDTSALIQYVEQHQSSLAQYTIATTFNWSELEEDESYSIYTVAYNAGHTRCVTNTLTFVFNSQSTPCENKTYDYYDTICDGTEYSYNGKNYTTSQTIKVVFAGYEGCDSTVNMHLTVMPTYDLTQTDTVYLNESGDNYSEVTKYNYQTVQFGCDSIVTVKTYYVYASGLEEVVTLTELNIYPNPAKESVTIEGVNKDIAIVDNIGRIVKYVNISDAIKTARRTVTVDISDLESGVYYIKIADKTKKLIIE